MTKKINLFSFFSGSGFLDLGFEKSGFNIKLVNEFFPSFMNAYKFSRKYAKIELPEFSVEDFDGLDLTVDEVMKIEPILFS